MSPSDRRAVLVLALAVSTVACSSDDASPRRETTVLPNGPVLACEPGDLDLAAVSGPGLSMVPLAIDIDQPSTLLGQSVYQSAPQSLCVPDDVVGLVLYGSDSDLVLPTAWLGSGIGELVDTTSVQTLVRAVTPDLSLPKSADVPLVAGRHTFELASDFPWSPPAKIALRRGPRGDSSGFSLNLILVEGCGLDQYDVPALAEGAKLFDQLYAQANVFVQTVGGGSIADATLSVIDADDLAPLLEASVTPAPDAPLVDGALKLFFVRELLSQETAGQLAGKAMGIPGTAAIVGKSGVVLSVDAHRRGATLDFSLLWTTAAHEVGHWHGLRHTTERWGEPHDYVVDTPQCSAWKDANFNGLVEPFECRGSGAENLMFWYLDASHMPTELTAGQAFVLHSALTMTPL